MANPFELLKAKVSATNDVLKRKKVGVTIYIKKDAFALRASLPSKDGQSNQNIQQWVSILNECSSNKVSLETELSETLYNTMKDFVLSNPTWDQYKLINSALATFLVQNGCTDNSVSEIYLNQLFTPSKSF